MLGQSTPTTTFADSKFNVASILSSMANAGELITPTSYPSVPNFLTSGHGTATLTPTSLASLEQTFIELQSVPSEGAAANGGIEPHTQSGFVPPVIDPASREQSQDSYDSSESDWDCQPVTKKGRGSDGSSFLLAGDGGLSSAPQRKYTRRSRNEKLSPEEEEKRRVRRERNKMAAAKCRQRRVDHTMTLEKETEELEAEQNNLESEIQQLQHEKDQLEFALQMHEPVCKADGVRTFSIKSEPDLAMACSASHMAYSMSSRPTSLPLKNGEMPLVVSCSNGAGIPISTPSSNLYTYTSFDSLVDGSTGLTPLTTGPPSGVSCASEVQHRNGGDGNTERVGSPTLVSL